MARPDILLCLLALVAACNRGDEATTDRPKGDGPDTTVPDSGSDTATTDTAPVTEEPPSWVPTLVTDLSAGSDIDMAEGGQRTRSLVVADFDNDGLDDLFVGNPGDQSMVLRNISTPGAPRFELAQTLSDGHISWTAAAADYDNDGDVDLIVGGGGNECSGFDQLWQNQLVETGELSFVDVRIEVGLTLANHGYPSDADKAPTTGVRWFDANLDGYLDLYIAHNLSPRCGTIRSIEELNDLWLNIDGERFERATEEVGLGGIHMSTRHPSILDYDNDGDLDIFDPNLYGDNVFYRNMLVETGSLLFGQVDTSTTGSDLLYPERAFASAVADINNDGLEDLVVFNRSQSECLVETTDTGTTSTSSTNDLVGNYHAVYLNNGAGGFIDKTAETGLEVQVANGQTNGVMGCQIVDVNGDGLEDVFVGNGGPRSAGRDDLYIGSVDGEAFKDISRALRSHDDTSEAFRTHGTVFFDVDGDSVPELVVGNGGPSAFDDVREPNRIFRFEWAHDADFLEVRLKGDGEAVNRDAIGARAELVFELSDGSTRSVHRTQRGGNGFSADNGRSLFFGLGRGASLQEAGTPTLLRIRWPDQRVSEHPVPALEGSGEMIVQYE